MKKIFCLKTKTFSPGSDRGFTLIELVLYIAVATLLLAASSFFIQNLLNAKTKNQAMLEVDEQGTQSLNTLAQTIRNAKSIISPASGESSSELSLEVDDAAKSPTVLDVSSGTLRIKEGDGAATALTGNRSTVEEINFKNLSRSGTPGIVRIEMTLSYASSGESQSYQYTKTFYASASLR